jgi:hypothetical protein
VNEYNDAITDDVISEVQEQKKTDKQDWLLNLVTMVTLGNAIACTIILLSVLSGCASKSGAGYSSGPEGVTPVAEPAQEPVKSAEVKLGIRMEGLRLSAAGYILDFRYRVVDPEKAATLLDRKIRPYLLDEASGAQLGVPDTAKLGQLRTSGRNKVAADQDYFILFANPGRFVQAGSKMTLVMGDMRIENLVVQ